MAKSSARSSRAGSASKPAHSVSTTSDHADGCDLEFSASEVTPDFALPPATGGVEIVKAARKAASKKRR
jgi:hypothetical protein